MFSVLTQFRLEMSSFFLRGEGGWTSGRGDLTYAIKIPLTVATVISSLSKDT